MIINVKTQEEYDKLMLIYEKLGLVWNNGDKPTKIYYFRSGLCIEFKNHFRFVNYKNNALSFSEFIRYDKIKKII